jgi:hypothetical protein
VGRARLIPENEAYRLRVQPAGRVRITSAAEGGEPAAS